MTLRGTVWRVGDNISTDEILPGRYLGLVDPSELGKHALEGVSKEIAAGVAPGDILVAGANFGTGSSREKAPMALLYAGFSAVVAASFARIFFRNCINVGLPAFWSPEAVAAAERGDDLEIDAAARRITNHTRALDVAVAPQSEFISEIVAAGGLAAYARTRLGKELVP